jgi:hypothetical protein
MCRARDSGGGTKDGSLDRAAPMGTQDDTVGAPVVASRRISSLKSLLMQSRIASRGLSAATAADTPFSRN